MATEEEIVEILLQSSGQEDLEESARKTVKTWQDAFRLIEDAYPDPIDAIDNIMNDINQVKDAIAQGFQVEGVDWSSLFAEMQDAFTDSAGVLDVSDWWDSILQAMLASGIDSQYIDQFVQDFESQLRDALGDIDADIDPPDIDFSDTEQQLRDMLSLFSGMEKIGLGNLFDIQSVEEFSNAIAGLHDINLNYVNRTLDELAARVGNMNIDDIVKDETIARLKEFQEAINQIRFDPTEDAITQIQQVMDSLGQNVQLDLDNIFDFNGIDDLREAISNLSENELRQLYDYLDQAADKIQHLNIDEAIKEGTVTQLREYLELIRQINEAHNDREGDSKLTQFLDRYKFSLALVGGALAGIMGMMRYSTTFGTALDVIGQAIGYLADVIMYPLLPYVMLLAEWIIGLADWFNALPDPIKAVVSGLFVLLGIMMIIQTFTGVNVFGWLKKALGNVLLWLDDFIKGLAPRLAAWEAMMAAGGLRGALAFAAAAATGLLIGLAVVYAMIQTGFTNFLATTGQEAKRISPGITGIWAAILSPIGVLGTIVIDMLTGQFDKIPDHIGLIGEQASAGFWTFVYSVIDALESLQSGFNKFMQASGAFLSLNPTTAWLGNAMIDQANKNEELLKQSEIKTDEQLKKFTERQKALGLMAQYGGMISPVDNEVYLPFGRTEDNKSSFMVKYEENMKVPEDQYKFMGKGDIMHGLTSEDQRRYLEQMDLVKNLGQLDNEIDEITNKYDNWLGYNDYLKAADDIDTTKNALQDLNKEFASGKITADEYQKKIQGLTNDLTGVNAAAQAVKVPTDKVLKTGDFFRTDDRDTDKSLSVNEMMKSRYDKMMHDYTTQSKYKNDAYLNPVNKAVDEATKPIESSDTIAIDGATNAINQASDTMNNVAKHIESNAIRGTTQNSDSPIIPETSLEKIITGLVGTGFLAWLSGSSSASGAPAAASAGLSGVAPKALPAPGMIVFDRETMRGFSDMILPELEKFNAENGLDKYTPSKPSPELPNSPPPTNGTSIVNNNITAGPTGPVTININGYNKDVNTLARELVPKLSPLLAKDWESKSRGSRI